MTSNDLFDPQQFSLIAASTNHPIDVGPIYLFRRAFLARTIRPGLVNINPLKNPSLRLALTWQFIKIARYNQSSRDTN
jgi:hypothetical protein